VGEDGESSEDAQLWALPPRGEAREVANRPGGFGRMELVADDSRLVLELAVHSQASTENEHAEHSKERTDAKVTAALHADFPTRYWDHDLGPSRPVLALADVPADGAELDLHYVALPPGRLESWSVDRAGTRALVAIGDSWDDLLGASRLFLVDLTGADRPRLLFEATAEEEYGPGPFGPDGTVALIGRHRTWTQTASAASSTLLLDLTTLATTPVWPELDHWTSPDWLDEHTLLAASDDQGRGSVWIGAPTDPAPRRLVGGPGQDLAFGDLQVAGGTVVASASGIAVAPHPVRIDPATGEVTALPNPADALTATGTLTEVTTTAEDGTELRAWLRLPAGEGPHPLVVFAHGGPWGSWNAWTYRWNPNPFVDAGYAVLLPDPAISTGYGQAMIDRGQHELGGAPFTDILALTDATVTRDDVDEARTAFAGGSYGGYMANWVAGHTGDRFRCIVTHASLWDTRVMGRTTDNAGWERPMRDQNALFNPADSVADIQVPMLVIHGDKDYRVPIGQGHALWYDLNAFSATPRDEDGRTRHRFLYFPDEGHWIQGRGNAQVWYEVFLDFLDEHVLGEVRERSGRLG
jgi:dipeptidyl aminopeptidase/acylaminoacyl peptidase